MSLTLDDLDAFEAKAKDPDEANSYVLSTIICRLVDEHRRLMLGRDEPVVYGSWLRTLHVRVAYWRKWRGLSIRQAAGEIGIAGSVLHRFEMGNNDPALSTVLSLLAWTERQEADNLDDPGAYP